MTSREDLLKMFGLEPQDMSVTTWSKFKSVLNHIQELELQLEKLKDQRCPNCEMIAKQANDLRDHCIGITKTLDEVCADAVKKCTESNIVKIKGTEYFKSLNNRLYPTKLMKKFYKDFPKEKDESKSS